MEPHFFRSCVVHCAKTCILRYMYFLKDRAAINESLSEAQVTQLHEDVGKIRECFFRALRTQTNGKLQEIIQYLDDMCSLIRLDFSQPEAQSLLKDYATRYSGENLEIARMVMESCLKLRPACSSYHKSVVEVTLGKAKEAGEVKGSKSTLELESDLLRKVFSPDFVKDGSSVVSAVTDASSATTRPLGGKNDAKYFQRQLDAQQRSNDNGNTLRLAGNKKRFSVWGHNEQKRNLYVLRRALDLNYGHMGGGGYTHEEDQVELGMLQKQDSLLDEGEKMAILSGSSLGVREVTVVVTDIKLRGISGASYFSKPNPYIVFQCAEVRRKTSVAKAGNDAEWGEENFSFQLERSQFYNGKFDKLQVWVFDKEFLRRKNHLGNVCISLAGINVHEIDSWFALEGTTGDDGGAEIHLRISFQDTHK